MRTLDRYVAALFIRNLFLSLGGLTALFMVQAMLGQLIDHEFAAPQVLYFNLLQVPGVVVQMTPPAVLLGTVLTLSGLNRNNELVACYSIGVGLGRLSGLILSIVFMVSCMTLVLQDRILPPLFKVRTTYYWREMKQRTDFFLDVKQDKIWYRSANLIYNLRTFDQRTQTIHGMSVFTFDDDFKLLQIIDAKKAMYSPEGWKLIEGTVTVFEKEEAFPLTSSFKEKEVQISETPRDFQEIEKEVEGLRLKELRKYIDRTRQAGADTKNYEVKFHSRISLSFIPLVMAILGVPFSVRNRREGGLAKDLGMCLGVTFFYWLFFSVGLSLGNSGALPAVLAAWLPSIIFGVFAAVMVARRFSKNAA